MAVKPSPKAKGKTDGEVVAHPDHPNGHALAAQALALSPQQMFQFSPDQIDVIKNTVAQGTTDFELRLFLHYCEVGGFDPMRKQAYATLQKSKCQTCYAKPENWNTPNHQWGPGACSGGCTKGFIRQIVFIPGIDGLMARAKKYPDFLGIRSGVVYANDEFEFDAVAGIPTVHKFKATDRGAIIGAWAVVFLQGKQPVSIWYPLSEYAKSAGFVGGSSPSIMVDKSAQAIVLRRAYPDPFSTSYAAEEFGGTINEDGNLTLVGQRWVHQYERPGESPVVADEPTEAQALIEAPAQSLNDQQIQTLAQKAQAVPAEVTAVAASKVVENLTERRPTADWDDPDDAKAQAVIADTVKAVAELREKAEQNAQDGDPALAEALSVEADKLEEKAPAAQPAPTGETHEQVERELNATLAGHTIEGVLVYKTVDNVKLVQVNAEKDVWKPAETKLGRLSPKALETLEAMFRDPKHRENHLERYFKVKTIPALTWEQLVACSMAIKHNQLDPRWYQVKITELAAKAEKDRQKALKSAPTADTDKLSKTYLIPWDDDLMDGLLKLADPYCLAYLYDKKVRKEKAWGKGNRDDLSALVMLVSTDQLELGSTDLENAVDTITPAQ